MKSRLFLFISLCFLFALVFREKPRIEEQLLPEAVQSSPAKIINASLKLLKPVFLKTENAVPVKAEAEPVIEDSNWGTQAPTKISESTSDWSYWEDPNDPPYAIVRFSESGSRILYRRPENINPEPAQAFRQYQSYYFASQPAVRAIAAERAAAAEERAADKKEKEQQASQTGTGSAGPETAKSSERLPPHAYEVAFFHPGKRDDGSTLVPVNRSVLGAIQGPDYSLVNFSADDDVKMRMNMSTVLSLGHNGEIMLRVAQNGIVKDEPGADFTLFENAFVVPGGLELGLEFGAVGISETDRPEDFRWYHCDPRNSVLNGCFGAVPTNEGGDKFDIGELGFKQIRYIWIKDLGINKNKTSKWPTEGCDLDAVRLDHAYTNP